MSQNNDPLLGAVFDIDQEGWSAAARQVRSPNCNDRVPDDPIDLLVIHNISLPPGEFGGPFVTDLFCNQLEYEIHPYFDQLRSLKVSAHFLIRRDGELVQFVSTHQRAWHAGVSAFDERQVCNDFSIGIEMEGSNFVPFEPIQYQVLVRLTDALRTHHPLKNVAGHQHIAPDRKTDPGPFFDWELYQRLYVAQATTKHSERQHAAVKPITVGTDTCLQFPPSAV
jgi:AmpD protein